MAKYLRRYPDEQVEMICADRLVDMVEDPPVVAGDQDRIGSELEETFAEAWRGCRLF